MYRPCLKKTGAESKESRRIVCFEEAQMKTFVPLLVAAVILSISCTVPVACATEEKSEAGAIETLLSGTFKPAAPGAAVIVTRKGQALFRKGYGMADLELQVPIEPDMVFRLGSVTKQFTAVAILMLEEEGKLSVSDPITKFLTDYPTQGQTITVEHLLTHTSGIRSYTEMPEWLPQWRKDFTLSELIDFFKNQPMDFAPDERWLYDNSGYILLGAIIEKASGQSYEDFIRTKIFEPLGMKHSYYDHTERIIPKRVKGYERTSSGFQNAAYLSMTQPYAAGSLASSVDDLALWDSALWSNKLLKPESLAKAHKAHVLKTGRVTGYGYGWAIGTYEGHRTVEHGGGINGFATYALSLPDDRVFVAILTNGSAGPDASPESLAVQMAGIAIGTPVVKPVAISMKPEQLDRYTGVYAINDKEQRFITREGSQLYSQRSGGTRYAIQPLSEMEFFFPGSLSRLVFAPDSSGKIVRVELRPRVGPVEEALRTDKPLPSRKEVQVDSATLQKYVGVYELAPNFLLTVTLEDGKLMTQATGQSKVQVFPESDTKFFLKVTDAQVEFIKDDAGNVTSLKLYQGGQIVPARKLK
jgi:CubicO group peptidase (beta-lactamase class C family)